MKRFRLILTMLALLVFTVTAAGCSSKDQKPVANVGQWEILYEELRYETLAYLSTHKDATEEELRAAAEQAFKETCAVLALCAERLSLSIESDSVQAVVDTELEKAVNALGSEADFETYLKGMNLTRELMRRKLAVTHLQIQLEAAVFQGTHLENKESLITWLDNGNYARVRRIVIPKALGEDTATALHTSLVNGSDPTALFTAEQIAQGAKCHPAEYFFRDLKNTDTEREVMNLLPLGKVTRLFEEDDSYVCYVRVDNDRETLVNYQAVTALEQYREKALSPLIEEKAAELTLVWNELGASLTLKNLS